MTISTTTNRVTYTGNGVTVAFSFPYAFFAQADLVVVETIIATGVQTVKTITTHYTISGSVDALGHYPSGGTVTAVTAPASTKTWTIYRDPTATQTTDLVENDPMPAESIEAALDYQTMLNQRTRDIAARSLQQPEGDSATIDRLPAKVDRASKYLAFDADGDPIAADGTTEANPVSTFMATVLDDTTAAAAAGTLGVLPLIGGTLTGDLLFTDATYDIGASGATRPRDLFLSRHLTVGGNGTITGNLTVTGSLVFPPAGGHLFGLTLSNNGSDATNDIDIAVGACASDDATSTDRVLMSRTSILTKQLDAAWAVGSAAGGLDTGTIANTTYHVYLIQRPDTGVVDALFSTSASAPTMPTNYTKKRRIGSILREGGAIVGFVQDGNLFARKVATLDVDATNPGTSAVTRTLKVPVGINVVAHVNCAIVGGNGATWGELISSMDMTDAAPSLTAAPLVNVRGFVDAGGGAGAAPLDVRTNTSAQVRSRSVASDASYIVRVATMGWTDTRGLLY